MHDADGRMRIVEHTVRRIDFGIKIQPRILLGAPESRTRAEAATGADALPVRRVRAEA